MCPRKLTKDELEMSILLTRVDEDLLPEYKNIFGTQDAVKSTFINEECEE